jgi:uncharacterized protein (DUF58 family)
MKFTRQSFYYLALWFSIAIIDGLWRLWDYFHSDSRFDPLLSQQTLLANVWMVMAIVFIALLVVDRSTLLGLHRLKISRKISNTLPVNSFCEVELTVAHDTQQNNSNRRRLEIEVFEHIPQCCETKDLPATIRLEQNTQATIDYQIKSMERGDLNLTTTELWVKGLLGFLNKRIEIECQSFSKVYPNFRSIHNYVLLATEQRTRQLGIRQRQKRGAGLDFHQLREYRMGDSLRQIDWRSTSRLRKIISKEYQQERDQNIIFLLDSGRRMRTKDGDLSHFDQALNATLLVSHIALKQGDAVGLKVFGAANRFIPPKKGPSTISSMLNQVYDLQPANKASDLIRAAEELNRSFKKRSLVVLVSNIRTEDKSELTTAVKMLKKHHLVLVTNLKEQALEDSVTREVLNLRDALQHAQTADYLQQREKLHQSLTHGGVITVDSLPSHLAINMANQYFDIKRSGRL